MMTSEIATGFLWGIVVVATVLTATWVLKLTREVAKLRQQHREYNEDVLKLVNEALERQVRPVDVGHLADLVDRRVRRVENRMPETEGPDLRLKLPPVPLSSWERISADDEDGV